MTHMSSVLQSNGTTNTKSKPKFVFQGHPLLFSFLITCLFVPLHASFPLLTFLACLLSAFYTCLFISFACLLVLCLLCLLYVHAWSLGTTSKTPAKKGKNAILKREMFSRLGGLASLCGFLSLLDVFFRNMSIAF